jgi:hypothetical protein
MLAGPHITRGQAISRSAGRNAPALRSPGPRRPRILVKKTPVKLPRKRKKQEERESSIIDDSLIKSLLAEVEAEGYEERECSLSDDILVEAFIADNEKLIFKRAWTMLGTTVCRDDILSAATIACYKAKVINRSAVLKCKDTTLFWWMLSTELHELRKLGYAGMTEQSNFSGGGTEEVDSYDATDYDIPSVTDETVHTTFTVCSESFRKYGFSNCTVHFLELMCSKVGTLKDKMSIMRRQYNCQDHQTIFDSIRSEITAAISRGIELFKVECFDNGCTTIFACGTSQLDAEKMVKKTRKVDVIRSEPLVFEAADACAAYAI